MTPETSAVRVLEVEQDIVGRELEPLPVGDALRADWILGAVRIDRRDPENLTPCPERSAVVRWLEAKMRREYFEQSFVRRIDRTVVHRDADAETDVEAMPQVDVAQLSALDGETMGFRNVQAGLEKIMTQAIT